MENSPVKHNPEQSRRETMRHNWEVMKPFVHFAAKAMMLVGGALVGIIKLLPALFEHKNNTTKRIGS